MPIELRKCFQSGSSALLCADVFKIDAPESAQKVMAKLREFQDKKGQIEPIILRDNLGNINYVLCEMY